MSVPMPFMLLDQMVSRSFEPCMCGRNGSPAGVLGVAYTVAGVYLLPLLEELLYGLLREVVRDWNARESKVLVTPGGRVTGNSRFRGRRVDVGECRGGWVWDETGNSGM
eukprot:scaffold5754_cov73-Cylindrotheca_fusiformis.AAC.2